MTNAPPDTVLLEAWAERGDEAAFTVLVERHVALVQGVARRRLDDELAAREVTQTVFAILARKASSLKNVRVLAAWLHRVAAAQSARAIRQLVRDRRLRDSAMQHVTITSAGCDPFADALPLLDAALDGLPESDRALLLLRYSEGISFAEAALRLGRSEAALRQQASRAVEKLSVSLRRRGVAVPAATIAGGMAAALGGGTTLRAAEVAQAALSAAPAVSGGTLFLTSLLTMSTLKFSLTAAGIALLVTGVPAVWQGRELNLLRAAADKTPEVATAPPFVDTVPVSPAGVTKKKTAKSSPGKTPAALDMNALGEAMEGSMKALMTEGVQRWANIEARRAALALGLSPQAERALRERITQFMQEDFDDEAAEGRTGNFQQRMRKVMEEHLTAAATPEQVEQWRTLRRQREETEIEKVAADAFHSTARLVDLTPEQKDALFQKCSEAARELYATNWKNSVNAGAAITPRPAEPLENDGALLHDVLRPEQLADWQTLSTSQSDYYDTLPRRVMGGLFSVVSGGQLADALREEMPAADAKPATP